MPLLAIRTYDRAGSVLPAKSGGWRIEDREKSVPLRAQHFARKAAKVKTYVRDDCVTVVSSDKIFYFAGRGFAELVAAYEVRCQVKFGRITARGAIRVSIDLCRSSDCVGHVRSRATRRVCVTVQHDRRVL